MPENYKETAPLAEQLETVEAEILDARRQIGLQRHRLAELEDRKRSLQEEIKAKDQRVYEDFLDQIRARGEKIEEALNILRGIATLDKEGIEY